MESGIKTKEPVFILTLILLIFTTGLAQKTETKFNLSGDWILDKKSSNPLFKMPDAYTLKIVQTETELTIDKTYVANGQTTISRTILYLDGRGEKNNDLETKTILRKNSLVRDRILREGDIKIGQREKYTLSKDGKKLTIDYVNPETAEVFYYFVFRK
jgi:hypothetical protein